MVNEYAVVTGSLGAVARQGGVSLAESFVSADAIVIFDSSGSMDARDSRGGKSRYDVALEELSQLQATMPGKIAVIAFSDSAQFCPGGVPPFLGQGTDLAAALRFARVADVPGMKFVVCSDGQPDDEGEALAEVRRYKNPISVIFVGREADPRGRSFLAQLASATGGTTVTADRVMQLAEKAARLLLN